MGLKKFGEFEGAHNEALEANKANAWKVLDNNREIIDVAWRTAGKWGTAGIVAVKDTIENTWTAYLGISDDSDEKSDAIAIADWGTALPKQEAEAFFPKIKDIKYGK